MLKFISLLTLLSSIAFTQESYITLNQDIDLTREYSSEYLSFDDNRGNCNTSIYDSNTSSHDYIKTLVKGKRFKVFQTKEKQRFYNSDGGQMYIVTAIYATDVASNNKARSINLTINCKQKGFLPMLSNILTLPEMIALYDDLIIYKTL